MAFATRVLLLLIVLLGSGAERAAAQADAARTSLFDEVWRTVRERFYDPNLNGLDWTAVGERYRPAAAAAQDDEARAAVINAMLAELGASHTALYTRDDPAFYQLADIFLGRGRRDAIRRHFPSGEVTYDGIGAFTRADAQGRVFVTGVIEATPAARAGLLTGDEILSADDGPFRPVGSFAGKAGVPMTLTLRRQAEGPALAIAVVPETIRPTDMFMRALTASARVIDTPGGTRVGYVRLWSYANPAYQRELERLIAHGPLKDADALVWDLRDGWGGAEAHYLDLFNARAPSVEAINRAGEVSYRDVRWRKPVAMLVNGGTRSGKEILAHGFKKYGIGPVVGTRTAKAVLAGSAFFMADGSLLLLAVNDVRVDGERLEGVGVAPTVEVPFDPAYAGGSDPQLDRAVRLLARPPMR